jgi:pyruvate formate lyase activating enzyme
MATCKICKNSSPFFSKSPGVCIKCIREKPNESLYIALLSHKESRLAFGLPSQAPKSDEGVSCKICVNECRIPEGQYGYCGLRKNEKEKLIGPTYNQGKLSWYLDPLPTNCVADWVCAGGTGDGYPQYAYTKGPEYGFYNLAVFFHACSFNCLYCQNWHFRQESLKPKLTELSEPLKSLSPYVSCICYFGGDPTTQIIFSLRLSELALKQRKGKILRICWETNGSMHKAYLERMLDISLISGGCIKFDLKAWDENLHITLTGVSNRRTLENFKFLGSFFQKRSSPPLVVASTLLVSGYIDNKEIENIAKFIASINPEIPYRLLAFYPTFYMNDLPVTSKKLAYECYEVALKAGLKKVSLGNEHLIK